MYLLTFIIVIFENSAIRICIEGVCQTFAMLLSLVSQNCVLKDYFTADFSHININNFWVLHS